MKEKERTYQMYIDDIIMAIDRIFEYTEGYGFNKEQILKIK
jgi:uncharacterized protein with HEPN domain